MEHQPNQLICTIDGVSFRMGSAFDFGFLRKYGRVFKVFDDQDSGNICFGLESGGERYFLKFAGAPTARRSCTQAEAIANLKASLPLYEALRHESLIDLLGAEDIGGGYAALFRWADGICMGRMYDQDHAEFMALPTEDRLRVYHEVLRFLDHVNRRGYVAVDFYDGSVMYDVKAGKTTICDIDFFQKKPYRNQMGRMWGSSIFMSPEEYELGAPIDEKTNVYAAGAMAFALFGGYQREEDAWQLGRETYLAARRAVSDARDCRQRSPAELMEEWNRGIEKDHLR